MTNIDKINAIIAAHEPDGFVDAPLDLTPRYSAESVRAMIAGAVADWKAEAEQQQGKYRGLFEAVAEKDAVLIRAAVEIDEANVRAAKAEARIKELEDGQEPVAYMWQHDETGRIGFVEVQQIEDGWQQNNPRLAVVSKLYLTPPTVQAAVAAVLDDVATKVWVMLMDWCKERRTNPSEHNELFSIVSAVRAIPRDDSALREICMKCFKAGQKASGAVDSVAEAIVDTVLKGEGK